MLTIAITGGIGCGKSAVTEYLSSKGYIVIDADKMSREMTSAGGKAIPYILEHFGSSFIQEDGSMDRAKMRDLVFSNPRAKAVLEEGTTKKVIEEIDEIKLKAEKEGSKVLFFDIPLLFESKREDDYDKVWVISTDLSIRKERLIKRDGLDEHIIDLIIGSQAEEDYRLSKADVVIYNNGTKEELFNKIDLLLDNLMIR